MTKEKPPLSAAVMPTDPYAIRSLERLLSLFNGGEFISDTMEKHDELLDAMQDHFDRYGPEKCTGVMTIKVSYAYAGQSGVTMSADATFTPPKKPAAKAAAHLDESGQLTLMSDGMRRMRQPIRDVDLGYDPETGEVRDVD